MSSSTDRSVQSYREGNESCGGEGMSTTNLSQTAREWRRHRTWQRKQPGWKQKEIAAALGVSQGAVSQ